MLSLGYFKDCVATVLFIFLLFFIINVDNINPYKGIFIIGLLLAIIIDGTFSLNAKYHNAILGYNNLTYFVIGIGILFSLLIMKLLIELNS